MEAQVECAGREKYPSVEERPSGEADGSRVGAARAADLLGELTELVMETAPRRFGLCAVDLEEDDVVVLGWGFAFADHAIVCAFGGRSQVRLTSPASAPKVFAGWGDVRLVWVDPEADAESI